MPASFRLPVLLLRMFPGGLGLVLACALQAREATVPPDPRRLRVQTVHPRAVQHTPTLRAGGSIAPWEVATISAEIPGLRVVEILVDVGAQVKKGQVLARLDAQALQLERRSLLARVAQARVAWQEAQDNARRAQQLRGTGAMTQQQIAAMLAAGHSARQQLHSMEAQLEGLGLRLARTRILAPDDGVILSRHLALGQVAGAGQALFRLARQGRLEWRARLGGQALARLAVGQAVRITLPCEASMPGTVRAIAPELDGQTRQGIAHVALEPQDGLLAGLFAQGEFLLEPGAGWSLPNAAVIVRDGHSLVWRLVPGPDGVQVVRAVPVHIVGHAADGHIILDGTGGMTETDDIVLRGGEFLADGEAVQRAP